MVTGKGDGGWGARLRGSLVVQRVLAVVEGEGRPLVKNSAFLIANTLVGSLFGFLFWLVAAHNYTPEQVGAGAACISAVTLVSMVGEPGVSTALVRFLPRLGGQQAAFLNTGLAVVGLCSLAAAGVFAAGTPLWSPQLAPLLTGVGSLSLFLVTAAAFAMGGTLDYAFVACQSSQYMFVRNMLAAALRLTFVWTVGRTFGAIGLLLAVGVGALTTMLLALGVLAPRLVPGYGKRPWFAWALLWDQVGYALGNHVAKLLSNAPTLVYPLVVVGLLGTRATAYFYTSWMIANMLFVLPDAVSTAAFARASNQADGGDRAFWRTTRRTLVLIIPIAVAFAAVAPLVLRIYGQEYVTMGSRLLTYLVLSIVPNSITSFIIVHHRIRQTTRSVIGVSGVVAMLCLVLSIGLGMKYGLAGIGLGWLLGQVLGMLLALLSLRRERGADR